MNTEELRKYQREYYIKKKINEPDYYKNKKKETKLRIKLKIFVHYSKNGIIECICCKEKNIKFLVIDHINNDGAKQREKLKNKGSGYPFYRWIRDNNYPNYLRILCHNCNIGRYHYKICPHKL